jgi:hypothetical protein
MRKAAGWALLMSPFITVAALGVVFIGLLPTLATFAITAVTVGVINLGCYLLCTKGE